MKKLIAFLMIFSNILLFSQEKNSVPMIPIIPIQPDIEIPENPKLPSEDLVEFGGIRKLEKNMTVMLNLKLDVVVPLEIISDVDVEAMVIDNQKLEVPFDVELNKVPDKLDYYKLKFSETEIDIDNDGEIDTTIYTPPYINKRIVEENILYIDGEKISKEGVHQKKVYMTIEVKE